MATLAVSLATQPISRTASATLSIFVKEIRYEFLKLFRTKTFSLSVVGFPVMFYILFGLVNRGVHEGGVVVAKAMLGTYSCFGMIGAALFGIGVGLASERAQGWLELKRASPMPPLAYLLAKCITAQAFGVLIVAVLIALALLFGGVHLSLNETLLMFGMTIVGTVPFATLGLLVALLVPANAASGVVNLIYLPMSFMSGLWVPIQFLPHFLQTIAPIFPAYHLSQLMLSVYGYQTRSVPMYTHWLGLAGFTLLMLGISWAVFHRAEQDA